MKRLILAGLVFALAIVPALAADKRVETLISPESKVSGENAGGSELSEDADAYSFRYLDRLGDSGLLSIGYGLERLDLPNADGGAFNLSGLVRLEAGKPMFGVHATGGFGILLSDVAVIERAVSIATTESFDSSGKLTTTTTTTVGETEQTEQETGGSWTLEAGVRGGFTNSDRMGWLLAWQWGGSAGSGFLMDDKSGWVFALTIPVERAGS